MVIGCLLLCLTVVGCKPKEEDKCDPTKECCDGKGQCGGGDEKEYKPKWDINQIGFNGKGMSIGIKVLPVNEYDPFDTNYTGTNKVLKQQHQRLIENTYDVKIKWDAWEDSAAWGPTRVTYIKEKYMSNEFKSKDVYAVTIASSWIPTLVKSKVLAELYDTTDRTGIFKNASYEQDATYNASASVNGKVYGYLPGNVRPDYFLFYNADLAKQSGMTDPAELWFQGKWTEQEFENWVRQAQTNLPTGSYALDTGYAEFAIGLIGAKGGKLVTTSPATVNLLSPVVTDTFTRIQGYVKSGWYAPSRAVQDVNPEFLAGKTIFATGGLWFLKNSTRFDPEQIGFEVGCVPYPTANGQGGTPITTTDANQAIKTRQNEALKTEDGAYISGVDMSQSSFKVPYTDGSCYSVLNLENGKNGITSEIVFNILHDLVSGLGADPEAKEEPTPEDIYRAHLKLKLDSPIYIEAIMSVQQSTYFEMIEILSMTVGNGSHYSGSGFWPLAANLCKNDQINAATRMREVIDEYKAAMRSLGYIVA